MFKRFIVLPIAVLVALSGSLLAQDQGPTDDQMAMMQQMQGFFQTVMQNMQDKGIDPQQFFQQMQNGTDPAEMQQQLLDQGLIDQKTLDQLSTSMVSLQGNQIKTELNATDDEWKILWPLIQKVMTASAPLEGTRGGTGGMGGLGMGGGFMTAQPKGTDLAKATTALRAALKDPTTPAEKFTGVLADYRAARAKAQQTLDASRQELITALTVRQEGILTSLGIIE